MAGRSRVRDRDNGAKALFKRFGNGKIELKVGIVGSDANQTYKDSGLTVAEIGTIHEFGLGNNPQRSFVREPLDQNKARLRAAEKRALRRVIRTDPLRKAAEKAGQEAVLIMREAIDSGITPPLKPATIARKGSTQVLVDTGLLYDSLSYVVEKAGD